MEVFKEAIVELSDVYSPDSWMVVHHYVKIAILLNSFTSCAYLGDCIANMKEKWLKYFLHIPDVFLIAKVLDPRVRVDGLEELLTMYYDALFPIKNDDTPRPSEIASNTKQLLFNIYREYTISIDKSVDITSSGDQGRASSMFYKPMLAVCNIYDVGRSRKRQELEAKLCNIYDVGSRKRQRDYSNPYQEFENYFTTGFFEVSYQNILSWWSLKTGTFPIMSLIAKEILACPASTLSVEQAFSVEECTLDERQSALTVEDLENQCLLEDWTSGELRIQDAYLDTAEEEGLSDAYDDVNIMTL
ncbi:hypothetical protein ACS0TY_022294 [Phlomoides rotata]